MKRTHLASAIMLSAAFSTGAWAQAPSTESDAELDIIMSVVDEDDTPEDVINRIELPPAPEAVVDLPPVPLEEPPLDRAGDLLENTTRDAATTVTESVNDALSTGDLESLPKDITDALPEEVIDEVLDEAVDDVDEVIDELTETDDDIDSALDELEATSELDSTLDELGTGSELDGAELDSAVEELDSLKDPVTEDLDETLDSSGTVDDVMDDINSDVGGGL